MYIIGLMLLCSFEGKIQKVVLNNVSSDIIPDGTLSFIGLFNPATRDKAQSFFLSVVSDAYTEDWELIFETKDKYMPMKFSGIKTTSEVILIGETTWESIVNYFNETNQFNNEQIEAIRKFYEKRNMTLNCKTDIEFLEEMTKLNNELVNAQRELNKKNIELEKMIELKNLFVGMVAHDLRNPICMIREFSKILSYDLENSLTTTQKQFLDNVQKSSDFMLSLVEDILQLTSFEAGKINLSVENHDLCSLITSTVALNQYIADNKETKIFLEMNPFALTVAFDWFKIQQVLNNLISNAIKFSPFKSIIRITTAKQDNFIMVCVQDYGPGISQDELKTLFAPFARGSAKATNAEPSTGLGLAIAKNIIKAHNGKLWADSIPGQGSTFSFSLPV